MRVTRDSQGPARGVAALARRHAGWFAPLVFLLLIGNFFWFVSDAQRYGGGALNGMVQDGHYFLSNHGVYTEVDRGTWEWMRFREISVFLGFPIAILGGYLLSKRPGWQWTIGGPAASAAHHRLEHIERSGRVIVEGSPPIHIGSVQLAAGEASLSLHPAGLIIRLSSADPVGIVQADIVRIEGPTPGRPGMRIAHLAPDIGSPVVVLTAGEGPLATAIGRVLAPNYVARPGEETRA